ncbi:MAG: hypothetical protein JKY29_10855, partial [Gammaproteobacteria bacterium]|nr:hypothetical protein [Gammaproteobacteria bacterium]MBL4729254.1 hypothetical protein [Gammaproteobacteria bacterium]
MIDFLLNFSQATGIYAFMNSPWGWPIVESLHFFGLCLLIGTVGLFDLRMLGFASEISLTELHRLVPIGVGGYLLNVVTGTMFLSTAPDQYLYNPAVQSKLFFMLIAGINMLLFYATTAANVRSEIYTSQAIVRAKIFAGVSLICWC